MPRRIRPLLVLVSLVAAAMYLPLHASASPADAQGPPCLLHQPAPPESSPPAATITGAVPACYAPEQRAQAEALMAIPPVMPLDVVTAAGAPALTQVEVSPSAMSGAVQRATSITYLFGNPGMIACSAFGVPRYALVADAPPYAIITERAGVIGTGGLRLTRDTATYYDVAGLLATNGCAWAVDATLPGRALELHIWSNLAQQTVVAMAQAIMQASQANPLPPTTHTAIAPTAPISPTATSAPAHPSGQGDGCAPLVQFHAGIRTCYLPAHVARADRRMPVRPVDPMAIVGRVAHLALSQVIVVSGTGAGLPGPAVAIVYVFGRPPVGPCPTGAGCPRPRDFVIVQETVGRTQVKGVQLTQGSFDAYGAWLATATIPRRDLSLTITSNVEQQRVLRIEQRIVRAAA